MNRMASKINSSASVTVWLKNALCLAGLAVLSVQSVRATDPIYQNLANSSYTVPGNPPPIIDATIFDNESQFNITYTTYSTKTSVPYEFKNTIDYTNGANGLMTFNSPPNTNGFIFSLYGVKAEFDTWAPALNNNFMAGSFFNQGTIRVDSLIDNNNVFDFGGFQFYILTSLGQCIISATNITNPGDIVVGAEGLMQMTGQNVDLTRGVFTMESTLNANQGVVGTTLLDNVNFNSVGVAGLDTNGDWNPGLDLNANSALSSFVPISPYYLVLTNSTAYFSQRIQAGTGNVINRAVFVENNSPQAPYNVYIDEPGTINLGFEGGAAHVEWVGSSLDPSTGISTTNYLYLTDNYVFGASTNVAIIGGVPDNFSFVSSSTPLLLNPVTAGFQNIFTTANITNPYSYMNGQILATSVSTNVSDTNPHGTLTNLPARFMISASQELNLANAIIGGQNYLSLTATNQFDGSAGAQILSPYADLNLGVTNGFLTISNLLEANLPNWSGGIQAWSTRWIEVDPNTGLTNDFRVLLVYSQLQPTSVPWVQNLKVHCATNLVISDTLNVYSSLSIDAQQITLTTNIIGGGATSLDGELNWIGNGALGLSQLPNLSCLTNNGAIRTGANLANFIGQSSSVSITPGSPATTASGTLSKVGNVNLQKQAKVVIGTNQYVFVSQLVNKTANEVKLGSTLNGSISNLIAAINGAPGAGKIYSTATKSNLFVRAGALVGNSFTVTAAQTGAAGNAVPTTTTSARLTWNGHNTLFGGANAIPAVTNSSSFTVPYVAFINNGLVADQGTTLFADNFLSSGVITNGAGNFTANTLTTTLTNGAIYAGGNISLTADTLLMSNLTLQCLSLTLTPTNFIDAGLTNGNFWTVGSSSGTGGQGFDLAIKPPTGDLLGTTITNLAPGPNKAILNTWAGTNYGVSVQGYSNNMAIGHLLLSVQGPTSRMNFTGATGTNNALYVDLLEFTGYLTNGVTTSFEFTNWLNINTNLTIYFGDALINGVTVAEAIDKASIFSGKNHGRLRWVPGYAGYYSSVPFVSNGVTNLINSALWQSSDLDPNGDGNSVAYDLAHGLSPFFTPDQYNVSIGFTNVPPMLPMITWNSIPNAMNIVYYSTNSPSGPWMVLTNFVSPVPYLAAPSAPKPLSVVDYGAVTGPSRFYTVQVNADLTWPVY